MNYEQKKHYSQFILGCFLHSELSAYLKKWADRPAADFFNSEKDQAIYRAVQAELSNENFWNSMTSPVKYGLDVEYCAEVKQVFTQTWQELGIEFSATSPQCMAHISDVFQQLLRYNTVTTLKKQAEGLLNLNTSSSAMEQAHEIADSLRSTLNKTASGKVIDAHAAISSLFHQVRDNSKALNQRLAAAQGKDAIASTVGISTGIDALDRYLDGLIPTRLYVIAARPSVGKSAFALHLIDEALCQSVPSVMVNMEMTADQCMVRLLAKHTRIDSSSILKGNFASQAELDKISSAAEYYESKEFYIVDSTVTDAHALKMANEVEQLHAQGKCELLVIDYLQLLEGNLTEQKTPNRNDLVAAYSRMLKKLAVRLNIPVVALSQLSRAVEKRVGSKNPANARPMKSDLRDSGAIEQDADVIIFLHPQIDPEEQKTPTSATIPIDVIIEKNRHGAKGEVTLHYTGKYNTYSTLPDKAH